MNCKQIINGKTFKFVVYLLRVVHKLSIHSRMKHIERILLRRKNKIATRQFLFWRIFKAFHARFPLLNRKSLQNVCFLLNLRENKQFIN